MFNITTVVFVGPSPPFILQLDCVERYFMGVSENINLSHPPVLGELLFKKM
jgi:hypothetical protein